MLFKGALLKRFWKDSWKISVAPFLLYILLPLAALLLRVQPGEVLDGLKREPVQQAISLSLVTSLATVAVTVLLGTPVAYYLAHRHYPLHRLVDTIIDLPTVLPPAVAGVALLMAFGRRGLVGEWLTPLGFTIPFTSLAVVMAQTFIAAPLYIKSATLGLAAVDCELRKAAALDGATRWQTFRYVMIPMSWTAILSGLVMTWARALGEFGATIIFAGNFPGRTQTMPLAIYIGFELDLDMALTLAVIFVGISFLVLILVKGVLHRASPISPEDIFD
jgi:molybdate transport system permease protein